jgi:hypothetical protein
MFFPTAGFVPFLLLRRRPRLGQSLRRSDRGFRRAAHGEGIPDGGRRFTGQNGGQHGPELLLLGQWQAGFLPGFAFLDATPA